VRLAPAVAGQAVTVRATATAAALATAVVRRGIVLVAVATAVVRRPIATGAMVATPVGRHGKVTAAAVMAAGLVVTVTAVVVRAAVPVMAVGRKEIVPVAVATAVAAADTEAGRRGRRNTMMRSAVTMVVVLPAPMLIVPAGVTRTRPGARRPGRIAVLRIALRGVVTRALTATAMAVRASPLRVGPVRAVVAVRDRAAADDLVSTVRADLHGRAIPALAGAPTIGRGLAVRAAQLSPAMAVRTASLAAGPAGEGMTGRPAAQTTGRQAA
jgi:hypothetical protein